MGRGNDQCDPVEKTLQQCQNRYACIIPPKPGDSVLMEYLLVPNPWNPPILEFRIGRYRERDGRARGDFFQAHLE